MPAASTRLASRTSYWRAIFWNSIPAAPEHCHRRSTSRPSAKRCACASSSPAVGCSNLSSTFAVFTLLRRPCGLSTCSEAGAWASTDPTLSSPSSSYSTCTSVPREAQHACEVAGEALQAMVPSGQHDLLGTSVALHGAAVIEHLVSGLHDQHIAARRDLRHVERTPLVEMCLGQFVRFTGVQVPLRAEIGAQTEVWIDRRIDQHRFPAMLFHQVGGIEAAERGADVTDFLAQPQRLSGAHRFARGGRERRTAEFSGQAAPGHVALQDLSLVRLRRGIEAVQVDDHAAAAVCRRPSSLASMPPKQPFDITTT